MPTGAIDRLPMASVLLIQKTEHIMDSGPGMSVMTDRTDMKNSLTRETQVIAGMGWTTATGPAAVSRSAAEAQVSDNHRAEAPANTGARTGGAPECSGVVQANYQSRPISMLGQI